MFRKSELRAIQNDNATTHVKTSGSRGVAATFGLDPRAALLMAIVDSMLFGGDVMTMGLLIPIGIAVGVVLAIITYKIQRHWYYKDDHESALIKALICGMLSAIPAPLGPFFAIPSGLLGVVKAVKGR